MYWLAIFGVICVITGAILEMYPCIYSKLHTPLYRRKGLLLMLAGGILQAVFLLLLLY